MTAPAPDTTVAELVERAQAGEADAFAAIYDRYFNTVFRFVYYRVGNRQLAEDLTADTFLRALGRISSFTWQGRDLGAWLVTIARNLVADYYTSCEYQRKWPVGDFYDEDWLVNGVLVDDRDTPEWVPELLAASERRVALLEAVGRLTVLQAQAVTLRFFEGMSVEESARALGLRDGALKALTHRAVRALARDEQLRAAVVGEPLPPPRSSVRDALAGDFYPPRRKRKAVAS